MENKIFLDNEEANDSLIFLSLPWLLILSWSQNGETHLHITLLREQVDVTACTAVQSYHKSKPQEFPALLERVKLLFCQCLPELQAGLESHFKVLTQPRSQNLKDECESFLGLTAGCCGGFLSGVATQVCSSLLCACPSRAGGSIWVLNWVWWGAEVVPLQAAAARSLFTVREEQVI